MEINMKDNGSRTGGKRKGIVIICALLLAAAGVFLLLRLNPGKTTPVELPAEYSDKYTDQALLSLNYAEHYGSEYWITDEVLYVRATGEAGLAIAKDVLSVRLIGDRLLYLRRLPAAGTNNLYCIDLDHMKTTIAAKDVASYVICEGGIVFKHERQNPRNRGLFRLNEDGSAERLTEMDCEVFWQYDGQIMMLTGTDKKYHVNYDIRMIETDGRARLVLNTLDALEAKNYELGLAIDTENNDLIAYKSADGKTTYYRIGLDSAEAKPELWFESESGVCTDVLWTVISSAQIPAGITPTEREAAAIADVWNIDRETMTYSMFKIPFLLEGRLVWPDPRQGRDTGRFFLDEGGAFGYTSRYVVLTEERIKTIP